MRISSLLRPASGLFGANASRGMATGPGRSPVGHPPAGDSFESGTVVGGRYRLEQRIRQTPAGPTFRASDLATGTQVALRLIATSGLSAGAGGYLQSRQRREAEAAKGIAHSHVARLQDWGVDNDLSARYFALEMLDGFDLMALTEQRGRPRAASVLRLLRDAAAGIGAGHRAGLTHRNICPRNIFLHMAGPAPVVKVLEFGMTGDAAAGGDPFSYASPEQLRGDWLSPATDVFSLAMVGQELLTCEKPEGGIVEMERRREALRRNQSIDKSLREVLCHALASHPDDRYPDGRAFLVALDEVELLDVRRPAVGGMAVVSPAEPAASQAVPATDRVTGEGDSGPSPPLEIVATIRRLEPLRVADALPDWAGLLGTAFVLTMAGSIAWLVTATGQWDTVAATLGILLAAMLIPSHLAPASVAMRRLRASVLGTVMLLLLAGILLRAAMGSLPDLLFAQILVSAGLPLLAGRPGGPRRSPGTGLVPCAVTR